MGWYRERPLDTDHFIIQVVFSKSVFSYRALNMENQDWLNVNPHYQLWQRFHQRSSSTLHCTSLRCTRIIVGHTKPWIQYQLQHEAQAWTHTLTPCHYYLFDVHDISVSGDVPVIHRESASIQRACHFHKMHVLFYMCPGTDNLAEIHECSTRKCSASNSQLILTDFSIAVQMLAVFEGGIIYMTLLIWQ